MAERATKLLAERGRPDVTVSPSQVQVWRERDALLANPAPGLGRGQGRKAASYPPGMERVAAELALALDEAKAQRELIFERAELIAFARGAPIPDEGLRTAYGRVFSSFSRKARKAHPSASPSRRHRLRLPASSDEVAARTALELLTHDDLDDPATARRPAQLVVEHTVEAVANSLGIGELAKVQDENAGGSMLAGLLWRLSLAAARRKAVKALEANPEDLRWAVGVARAFADFGTAWSDAMLFAGIGINELEGEYRLGGKVFAAIARLFADDLMVALAGPMFLLAPTSAWRRELDGAARQARIETSKLRAAICSRLLVSPGGDTYLSFLIEPKPMTLNQ